MQLKKKHIYIYTCTYQIYKYTEPEHLNTIKYDRTY